MKTMQAEYKTDIALLARQMKDDVSRVKDDVARAADTSRAEADRRETGTRWLISVGFIIGFGVLGLLIASSS